MQLIKKIAYEFSERAIFDQALRHRSMGKRNNERLEFLGDAALGLVIGAELYKRFPTSDEGDLSRMRSWLVRRETLGKIAIQLNLGKELTLGSAELKSGGQRRESILADAVEAIFGAVYLDGGMESCAQVILHVYRDFWKQLPKPDALKDPKTRLQEWLQSRGRSIPTYQLIVSEGPDHAKKFQSSCKLDDQQIFIGKGHSRRISEQQAAEFALKAIIS
ncbi:MAG: ribonuclease III [bacterium]